MIGKTKIYLTIILVSVPVLAIAKYWYDSSIENNYKLRLQAESSIALAITQERASLADKALLEQQAEIERLQNETQKEVVKYISTPNRTICQFDDDRVRIKQQAIDRANSASPY